MTYLILTLVALALFATYIVVAIHFFGIPESLSNTYYLYEAKHKGFGWFFTGFMWVLAFLLLPAWIATSDNIGPWMSNFTFLSFIAAAAIAFVGTAPKFHDDMEGKVHVIAASICAAAAILWDFVICWNIWYVTVGVAIVPAVAGILTKSWKKCSVFWLEMMAFVPTFATLITEEIILMTR